jgi:1-deoxy-D-xylulose-5-phosphate reductoisomerase
VNDPLRYPELSVKRLALLGATGSIGRQALDVVGSLPDIRVVALAAGSADRELCELARAHGVETIALADPAAAARARSAFSGRVLDGVAGLATEVGADIVLNACVGVAGLAATLEALDAGIDVALANKESLIAGGPLVLAAAARRGANLIPVDSEHSALHQLLRGESPAGVESLIVTASGGPFRGSTRAELADVSVADALRHPTWAMGARITVDSATLMNKGLEVIEAHLLFGVPYDRIEVVVQPQSIVHALVRLTDGALLAHLGTPDMRVPIAYALAYPERAQLPSSARLDLAAGLSLPFEAPDLETFRCLSLARAAGEAGGLAPCALNAADEEAVAAFLAGRCSFLEIPELVERALDAVEAGPVEDLAQVVRADAAAREVVRQALLAGVRR